MQSEYIVKKRNGEIIFFINSDDNVIYEKSINGEAVAVIDNVSKIFSVSVLKNEQIFIFCRKITGEIIIAAENNGSWEYKHILKQYGGADIKAYICGDDREIRLIYNVFAENKNILITQILSADGKWGTGERIDTALKNGIFGVRHEDGDVLIFYQQSDSAFGYRAIRDNYIGGFTALNKMNRYITDISYIYDGGDFHILYSVKSMLSGHLYYKQRKKDGRESLTILYEGLANKCCVYKIKGTLYFLWSAGENVFCRESTDGGNTFSKASRIKQGYTGKAEVVSGIENLKIYEAFTDRGSIIHLPVVYPEFNKYIQSPAEKQIRKESEKNTAQNDLRISKIKNKVNMLTKANAEKDRQIAQLTQKVYSRSKEGIESEVKLIKEVRKLKAENEKLKEELEKTKKQEERAELEKNKKQEEREELEKNKNQDESVLQ